MVSKEDVSELEAYFLGATPLLSKEGSAQPGAVGVPKKTTPPSGHPSLKRRGITSISPYL